MNDKYKMAQEMSPSGAELFHEQNYSFVHYIGAFEPTTCKKRQPCRSKLMYKLACMVIERMSEMSRPNVLKMNYFLHRFIFHPAGNQ